MNDSGSAKQQLIDRIKSSTTILVTVSRNPSVDELSAALAVTSFLNKLKKHATAVVSGEIPPAINFLDPSKTFENTVDSLRDFIIALNKEKADHLRYKVEGEVVKIFITPYRTTITNDDLDFSQGDYNVELVIALGVESEDHLDAALEAHGRILHDATVVTVTAGEQTSNLGSIDWHDRGASSISEMMVSLVDGLKSDAAKLDEPIATALLTGIVATTERFSNNKTSSRVMTIAAQLMAAGANQQLIAANLEDAGNTSDTASSSDVESQPQQNGDGTTELNEGESTQLDTRSSKNQRQRKPRQKKASNDGELVITHEKRGDLDEISRLVAEERQAEAARTAEQKLAEQLQSQQPMAAALPTVADMQEDMARQEQAPAELPPLPPQPTTAPAPQVTEPQFEAPVPAPQPASPEQQPETPHITANTPTDGEPMLGGTLNATTEQAADDKRREEAKDRNKKILSHGSYLGNGTPTYDSPINSATSGEDGAVDPFGGAHAESNAPKPTGFELPAEAPTARANPQVQPTFQGQTLADIDAANRTTEYAGSSEAARAEVAAAFNDASEGLAFEESPAPQFSAPAPVPPAPVPAPLSPEVPPLPDFSTLPPLPQEPANTPPADVFAQLPPLPNASPTPAPETPTLQAPPAQAPSPTQFRIPGQ